LQLINKNLNEDNGCNACLLFHSTLPNMAMLSAVSFNITKICQCCLLFHSTLPNMSMLSAVSLFERLKFIGNPCPGLGQAQKCGGIKLVNGIPALIYFN
jgi:hypothetical protein